MASPQLHRRRSPAAREASSSALDSIATSRRPSPSGRFAAWGLVAAVVTLVGTSAALEVVAAGRSDWWEDAFDSVVLAVAFTTVGGMIALRLPGHVVGWLFLSIGSFGALFAASASFDRPWILSWPASWSWWLGWALLPLFLLVFPTGRLPSPRWRWSLWIGWFGFAVGAIGLAGAGWDHPHWMRPDVHEAVPGTWRAIALVGVGCSIVVLASGLWSLRVRWRTADNVERRQFETLLIGAAAVPLLVILDGLQVPGAWLLAPVCIPAAAGFAVLRHRLYDLDLFVNRTLVYGTLTFGIVVVYATLVWLGERTVGTFSTSSHVPAVVATVAIALVLQPVRRRLQHSVDHLLYGLRGDPYAVVSAVGRRVEGSTDPAAVLVDVAESVAETLALPYVAIETRGEDGDLVRVAEWGRPGLDPRAFPMRHRGETIGVLLAAPRWVGHDFSRADRQLLEELARQVALSAFAVELANELRRSRGEIVRAREEERRRLRRDLHDHVGGGLAGLQLFVGARRALSGDESSRQMLLGLEEGLSELTVELRRLIDDLRPPTLDLGLIRAVRKQAARLMATGGLTIDVEGDIDPERLSAAVEAAAFCIATEALTNVVKHAEAELCIVRFTCVADALEISVRDDGRGLPDDFLPGLGLDTMRDRAGELGGSCSWHDRPEGGTEMRCSLPLG
jgi:two-component system NarL family sensor kinase